MVVYIVIIMAAALAFVVLFTLSTTNISERSRELATIKVLGFFDREVHLYVNKETMILTAIGIVCGTPLGYAFAQTLTYVLNMPSIYLAVSLHGKSYAMAAGLSFLFAILVDLLTNRSLDEISERLLFARTAYLPEDSLYSEQDLHGYFSILPNEEGEENTPDIELLYKAALQVPEKIKMIWNE